MIKEINDPYKMVLGPKPVKFRKHKIPIKVQDFVLDIQYQATFVSTVQWTSQAATDHLEIKIWAVHRAGYDDGTGLGRVETFPEDTVIDKRLNFAATKLFDDAAASIFFCLATNGARLDSCSVKECCHRL